MTNKQRDELLEMKEYIGVAEILSVDGNKSGDGEVTVNRTEMSPEETEEYLKVKNACNLNKIRKGVTFLVIVTAVNIAITLLALFTSL